MFKVKHSEDANCIGLKVNLNESVLNFVVDLN